MKWAFGQLSQISNARGSRAIKLQNKIYNKSIKKTRPKKNFLNEVKGSTVVDDEDDDASTKLVSAGRGRTMCTNRIWPLNSKSHGTKTAPNRKRKTRPCLGTRSLQMKIIDFSSSVFNLPKTISLGWRNVKWEPAKRKTEEEKEPNETPNIRMKTKKRAQIE